MFPCTEWYVTQSKEVSLSCTFWSYPASLPEFFSRSGNSLPDFLPGHLPGFLPKIVPDSLPESLPGTLLEPLPESYPSVLPGALLESLPELYPSVLPGALPEHLTRSCTPHPALPGRVTPYQLCPRSFIRANNLPSLSLVDPTLSLSAKFGLHLTQPTTRFYLYRPLTRLGFPGR
jgi:hypothetical protein